MSDRSTLYSTRVIRMQVSSWLRCTQTWYRWGVHVVPCIDWQCVSLVCKKRYASSLSYSFSRFSDLPIWSICHLPLFFPRHTSISHFHFSLPLTTFSFCMCSFSTSVLLYLFFHLRQPRPSLHCLSPFIPAWWVCWALVILHLSRHHSVGKPAKLDGQQAERMKKDDWMEASQRSEYSDRERGRLSETSKQVERQKRSQTGKQSNQTNRSPWTNSSQPSYKTSIPRVQRVSFMADKHCLCLGLLGYCRCTSVRRCIVL